MTQKTQHERRVEAAADVLEQKAHKHPGEAAALAADILAAADAVKPAGLPEGRDVFSVPPDVPLSAVLEAADENIQWAVNSGSYAPPESWFPRIPAFVALLRETTEALDSIVEAYEKRGTTADDAFAETLAQVLA